MLDEMTIFARFQPGEKIGGSLQPVLERQGGPVQSVAFSQFLIQDLRPEFPGEVRESGEGFIGHPRYGNPARAQ